MLKQLTDQSCVWMSAGLIRFWLCDRAFDCDNCPLDRALRAHRPFIRPPRPALVRPAADRRSDAPSDPSAD